MCDFVQNKNWVIPLKDQVVWQGFPICGMHTTSGM
jgi:hypothetical protein